MDQESLAQIKQIIIEATEAAEGRLREEIETAKRHTGVLVEHLEHKISLLAEGQQTLRQYVEDFRSETQNETAETRALLRLSYQQLHQRVEDLEQ
jgi:hypothetical protein